MKEYLKMSDVFKVLVVPVVNGDEFSLNDGPDCHFELAEFYNRDECEYAAHAINSHDELVEGMNHYKGESERWEARAIKEASRCVELVEMNKELLKTLKNALEECEFEIRHGGQVCVDICAIRKAIEMAKGSAA